MQKEFVLVQHHAKTRAEHGFDGGPEVIQQRLDLPPVDVARQRPLENRMQEVLVFVAHGTTSYRLLGYS
ncbi:hypothetical protein D3C86_2223440 [compost metagenome]